MLASRSRTGVSLVYSDTILLSDGVVRDDDEEIMGVGLPRFLIPLG
jgi:hypothetical protein